MLDIELLRTFIAIAEGGGFTAAATAVHRTQSAVSLQMRRLEEAVGRPLFEKRGRGVRLTADGERLLPHARRILAAEREALAAFAEPDAEDELRLGAPDDYAASLLPRLLPRFRSMYPCIRVEIVAGRSHELARRIKDGDLDLALTMEIDSVERPGGVVLIREPAVWITSPHHCTHDERPVPLAVYAAPCPHRHAAIDALDRQGRPYWLAYSSVSVAGIDAAVRQGLAVGVVGASSVHDGHRILGEAEGFPVLPSFPITLLRRPGQDGRDRLDRLQAHIVEAFRATAGRAA